MEQLGTDKTPGLTKDSPLRDGEERQTYLNFKVVRASQTVELAHVAGFRSCVTNEVAVPLHLCTLEA